MHWKNWMKTIAVCVLLGWMGACTKNPDTNPEVPYEPDIRQIFENYCITCHSGNAASAGLRLDNYDDARAIAETGKLISRINDADNPMPPSGLLPEAERKLIEQWVTGGMKP